MKNRRNPRRRPVSTIEQLEDRCLLAGTSLIPASIISGTSTTGNGSASGGSVSDDGRFTVYVSESTNLVSGQADSANTKDVFVYDSVNRTVALVSHAIGSASTAADGDSDTAVISANGRYVAYLSTATNLVAGQIDQNGGKDLFLFDRTTGETILVSRAAGTVTTAGNDSSGSSGFSLGGNPALSDDGRYLAFVSTASDLITGQEGGGSNVFLFDAQTGVMRLVSTSAGTTTATGNGSSLTPVISGNGRFVAYTSGATDIVPGQVDGNSVLGGWDLFLFDRDAVQTPNVLVSGSGGSTTVTATGSTYSDLEMSLSDDGRFLVFKSFASDLISGVTDDNGNSDIFVYDRLSSPGVNITLVSHAASSPTTTATGGSSSSETPVISADGLYVAYKSNATNIVASDNNNAYDVFVYSLISHTNILASHVSGGTGSAGGDSTSPLINADGSRIVYSSQAGNLVPGQSDSGGNYDVFVFDRAASTNILASGASGSSTTAADGDSLVTAVSSDGLTVVFASQASNIGGTDNNEASDVFVRQTLVPTFSLRAQAYNGNEGDGTIRIRVDRTGDTSVAAAVDYLLSNANLLVPLDHPATPDEDYVADEGTLVFAPGETTVTFEIAIIDDHALEFDESFFVYLVDPSPGATLGAQTFATVTINDDDGVGLISVNSQGSATGDHLSLGTTLGGPLSSSDGRFVAFDSTATDLVEGMANYSDGVYVRDMLTAETILVSRNAQGTGTGNKLSKLVDISSNGVFILFASLADDLVANVDDTNLDFDLFVFNVLTRTTTLVSCLDTNSLVTGNGRSGTGRISDDGLYVVFSSTASNLVSGISDNNISKIPPEGPARDVFLRDLSTGTTTLLSQSINGASTGDGEAGTVAISGDGRYVAFANTSSDLVANDDTNEGSDIFVWDRLAPTGSALTLVTTSAGGGPAANGESTNFDFSEDGRSIVWQSDATDLISGIVDNPNQDIVLNEDVDIFLQNLETGARTLVSHTATSSTTAGNHRSYEPRISDDGRYVIFKSFATDMAGTVPDYSDNLGFELMYRYSVETGQIQLVSVSDDGATPLYLFSLANLSNARQISADGRYAVFQSYTSATGVIAGITDINMGVTGWDVFLSDMNLGTVSVISRTPTTTGNDFSDSPTISGNGQFVYFRSVSSNLISLFDVNNDLYPQLDSFDVFVSPGQFNPGTFQFTDAEVSVSEDSTELILTIERTGGKNGSFLLDLATSSLGGTATANGDYNTAIRQIVFADGQTTAEVHITLTDDAALEANETFKVTLDVVGYDLLGANDITTVTIVDNDTPVVGNRIVEPDGDIVTITLKGPGTATFSLDDPDGDGKGPIQILLTGTSPDSSSLSFKVTTNKSTGNGFADIALIAGNGGLKSLAGAKVNLTGPGIALSGKVLSLALHDVRNGADIAFGGTPGDFVTLTMHDVSDGTNITLSSGIKTLTAARIGAGLITAPSLQTLNVKGDAKAGILGDIRSSLILSGQGIAPEKTTLAKATISHAILDAVFVVLGGAGSIGTITTGEMINAGISAGYVPNSLATPLDGGTFTAPISIGSVVVKGLKGGGGPAFSNSTIAATKIGTVTIASLDMSDPGEFFKEKYGVLADVSISRVNVAAQDFGYNSFGPADQTTSAASRFHVKIV